MCVGCSFQTGQAGPSLICTMTCCIILCIVCLVCAKVVKWYVKAFFLGCSISMNLLMQSLIHGLPVFGLLHIQFWHSRWGQVWFTWGHLGSSHGHCMPCDHQLNQPPLICEMFACVGRSFQTGWAGSTCTVIASFFEWHIVLEFSILGQKPALWYVLWPLWLPYSGWFSHTACTTGDATHNWPCGECQNEYVNEIQSRQPRN